MTERYAGPRLLILTGSFDTVPGPAPRHCLDHFDGPEFRLVRKYLADAGHVGANSLQILVLTAAGFIGAYDRVHPLMEPLDDDQAIELRDDKGQARKLHTALDQSSSVFIACTEAIEDSLNAMMLARTGGASDWMRSQMARGSEARKLNGLLQWLVRTTPDAWGGAELVAQMALAVECATDRPLSLKAMAVLNRYLDDLADRRAEIHARAALAAE